ncbi:MAG: murein L,D-transpeptidase family protein [Pyrinomonadaceae bacterium]
MQRTVEGERTVAEAVRLFGPDAETRLKPYFEEAGLSFPPRKIVLIGLKDEKRLELWAEADGKPNFIRSYEVKRASGVAGPKLAEGDRQVPEGFYRVVGLNANSSYHLSLKLNYPNEFDLQQAKLEGRTQVGGDIFIHGKAVSVGCLAMGDEAIEELFVLTERVGKENVSVIIAPHDLRTRPVREGSTPGWVGRLYAELAREMNKFKS